ncbi:A/G-specific adenine glycosylase [Flaviaesturariibacter amylovorans]|uniref:Adenine DNA glycosylase n=1 Tax=Flaviaesturariibacter amylovorans TaxID=1084520 RepID=A0ABP8G9R5_9BACT
MKETLETRADSAHGRRFTAGLLHWNATANDRPMPWKGETDPYRIWLSEIILQQTRVEQGWGYYERFVAAFPTVQELAAAPEQSVFKLWEGLGYYSRCRNLIATARIITEQYGGVFPQQYDDILALKGVGPYTAAAIASFAYNAPYAVLDGNVFRVLSRIFGCALPIDSTEGRKFFAQAAQELLPVGEARAYNQALMDFGATVCKPLPACAACFFQHDCAAFRHGRQGELPVKAKKTAVRERFFQYVLLQHENTLALHPRGPGDVWESLWEPLLFEAGRERDKEAILRALNEEYGIRKEDYTIESAAAKGRQRLSHQLIHFNFLHLGLARRLELPGFDWVPLDKIDDYPFPKTVGAWLKATFAGFG